MTNAIATKVTPEAAQVLPERLIDYLWQLALTESWAESDFQAFILLPGDLSGKDVQDVYHSIPELYHEELHRLVGLEPQNQVVEVFQEEGAYTMSLLTDYSAVVV